MQNIQNIDEKNRKLFFFSIYTQCCTRASAILCVELFGEEEYTSSVREVMYGNIDGLYTSNTR